MTDWAHVWEMGVTALCGSVPILLYMASNKRKAKAEQDKRHVENQEKLDTLIEEGKFFPAHGHKEKRGNLTVDGLRYPPGKDPRAPS